MSKTCFLLGGDKRQRWAAQALLDAGLEVRCCGVPGMPEALPAPADFVILPFPALQGERACAGPPHRSVPPCSPAAAAVRGSHGGGLSLLRQALLDCGAEPVELFGTEPLTTHNAVPTAEGAIAPCRAAQPVPAARRALPCHRLRAHRPRAGKQAARSFRPRDRRSAQAVRPRHG